MESRDLEKKRVLFTIGRMNPPTPGHKELIQQMMTDAVDNNVQSIYIILSSTTGDEKNPLECEEKRFILYGGMIDHVKTELAANGKNSQNVKVEVLCMDDPIPPEFGNSPVIRCVNYILRTLNPDEIDSVNIYLGDNEQHKFDWIQQYIPYKLTSIGVSRPPGDISATELRNLTINDKQRFDRAMLNLASGKYNKDQLDNLYENRVYEFVEHMMDIGIHRDEALEFYKTIGDVVNQSKGGRKSRKKRRGKSKTKKRPGRKSRAKSSKR